MIDGGVITDLHLKREVLSEQLAYLFRILKVIKGCLYILGDIFDDRRKRDDELLEAFRQFLLRATGQGIRVIIVTGNHDKTEDDNEFSLLTLYGHMENVTVYDDFHYDVSKKILYAPFFTDKIWKEKLKVSMAFIKDESEVILMGHKTLGGYKLENGALTSGLILPKTLKKFKGVLLGDLHKRQVIKNVYYIGALFQERFGEDNEKGVVFISDKKGIKFGEQSPEFYKTFMFDVEGVFNYDSLDGVSEHVKENNTLYLRLIFEGNRSSISKIADNRVVQTIKEALPKEKKLRIKIVKNLTDTNVKGKIVKESKNFLSDIIEYCRNEKMDEEQRKYGIKLLTQ